MENEKTDLPEQSENTATMSPQNKLLLLLADHVIHTMTNMMEDLDPRNAGEMEARPVLLDMIQDLIVTREQVLIEAKGLSETRTFADEITKLIHEYQPEAFPIQITKISEKIVSVITAKPLWEEVGAIMDYRWPNQIILHERMVPKPTLPE